MAQTHVSAGVDDGVHVLVEAHRALPALPRRRQLWSGEARRHRGAEGGAGGRDCGGSSEEREETDEEEGEKGEEEEKKKKDGWEKEEEKKKMYKETCFL